MNYYHFSIKPRLDWLIINLTVFAFLGGIVSLPALAADTREFTAAIAPTSALTDQVQSYTATFTNSLSSNHKIKSAKLINIDGFTSITGLSLGGGASSNWAVSLVGNEIKMNKTGGGAADIDPGESFTVIFTATAPGSAGVKQWTARAWEKDDWTNPEFSLTSLEPTVTVMTRPTITIVKHTLGGNGTFDFTGDLGAQRITTENGVGQTGPIVVVPGTYQIAETAQAHWREISSDCGNVVVAAGQAVICTIVNEHDTRITVNKTAVGGDGIFHFTGLGDEQGFNLNTALSPDHVIGSFFDVFTELSNNTGITDITIAEGPAQGWTTDQPCVLNDLQPGVDRVCEFTNTKLGIISGIKFEDLNGNGVKDQDEPGLPGWTIKLKNSHDQEVGSAVTDENGLYSFFDVFVDVYTVEEVGQAGWTQTTANPAPIQIRPGSVVNNIDFGNFKLIRVTVQKDVVAPDGTTNISDNHSFTVKLDNEEIGKTINEGLETVYGGVGPGLHALAEIGDPDFDLLRISNGDTELPDGQFTPVSGQDMTIVVTNKQKPGRIIIDKTSIGGDGLFIFTGNNGLGEKQIATVNGNSNNFIGSFFDVFTELNSEFTITEQPQNGWIANSKPCVVTVNPGKTATCHFINTKKGRLIVNKLTAPANDLTPFSITASGDGIITGDPTKNLTTASPVNYEVTEGTYSVAETVPTGWTQTDNTCDNEGIFVGAGETKECTIINTKQGQIIIKKITVGGDGLFNFKANYNPTGFSLSGGGQNDSGYLNPGDYNVSEDNVDGWALTSAVCDNGNEPSAIALNPGQTVACTFTNGKKVYVIMNGKRTVIKNLWELAKYKGQKINVVDAETLNQYPEVLGDKTYPDNTIIKNGDKLYIIKNGQKQYIKNLKELKAYIKLYKITKLY